MPRRELTGILTPNEENKLRGKAMAGDIEMVISPETVAPEPTAAEWDRTVTIELQTADGELHRWLTADYSGTLSIDQTSSAGTASIESTKLEIVNGRASVVVSGDAEDWLDSETDTLTVDDITVLGYTVTGGTSVETFTD